MPTDILQIVSLIMSALTLITFVVSMRKEAEKRGARQADLDNSIKQILEKVSDLVRQLLDQQKEINQLKMWIELLLQQHCANHGQEIRR